MRILFDQGTPKPLRQALKGHEVSTAFSQGWQLLQNGDLLAAAEAVGFEAIITTDKNLRYQQNLAGRRIAVVVLWTTDWRAIRDHTQLIADAVEALASGAYVELSIPTS